MNKRYSAILAIVAFVVLGSVPASAQTFIENWNMLGKDAGTSVFLDGQIDIPVSKTRGVRVWGLYSENWSELYASFRQNLGTHAAVTLGAGWEQDDQPWRVAATMWMGKGRFSSFLALEHGGSGFWYSYKGTAGLTQRLSVGVFSRRFVGTGPMAQVAVHGKTEVWGAYCPGSKKAVIAVSQGF